MEIQHFPLALRILREVRHLRQCELAQMAGITPTMLCSYEHGQHMPSVPTLFKLLVALDADFRLFSRCMLAAAEEQARRKSLEAAPAGSSSPQAVGGYPRLP